MSFYGQVVQLLDGGIEKIVVTDSKGNAVEFNSGEINLKDDGVIILEPDTKTQTITASHAELKSTDISTSTYVIIKDGADYKEGKIDAYGHITALSSADSISLLKYEDNDGSIIFY